MSGPDSLVERLNAATMRTDWNNLPDDACIPAVPLLREAAAELSALRSRCETLAREALSIDGELQAALAARDEMQLRLDLELDSYAKDHDMAALRAARDVAVAALEPFAKEAEAISKAHLDGHCSDLDMRPVAVGHLRAAARALTQDAGKEKAG